MVRYRLIKAHHPKRFEKGIYAVSYVQSGKPLLDRYIKDFQIKATSRKNAIKKARRKL